MQNIDGQRVATLSDLDRKLDRTLQGADGLRERAMDDMEKVIVRMMARFALMIGSLMCLAAVVDRRPRLVAWGIGLPVAVFFLVGAVPEVTHKWVYMIDPDY